MGDSTMQYNDATTYPQTGWGQMLPLFFNQDVAILNFARNGCSTKSFIDLGIFSKALNEVDETTYCLIQFGHNDQKKDNPLRYAERDTDYKDNLRHYIREIINRKGNPILITSVYRRFFDKNDDLIDDVHLGYPKAMMEVAQEMNIPCIDVCCQTKKMISYMGSEDSRRLFMIFPKGTYSNYPDGMYDNTHLRSDGAYQVAFIVAKSLVDMKHPLADYIVIK